MSYRPAGLDMTTVTVAAVAAALNNRFAHPLASAGLEQRMTALQMSRRLPGSLGRHLAGWSIGNSTHKRSLAASLTTEDMARWNAEKFSGDDPPGQFDLIVVGVPSGGTAHLCSCLGAPLLADSFSINLPSRGAADDIANYLQRAEAALTPVLSQNPDIYAVSRFDPIHARRQAGRSVLAQLKLGSLPEVYKRFIQERLTPGGALLLVSSRAEWGQYEIGPRHTLQVGGFGGFDDRDYTRGTPEMDSWLQSNGGAQASGWQLPRRWSRQPEAQWGSLERFDASVRTFAAEINAPVHTLAVSSVEEVSRLGFYAWQWLFYLQGIRPGAVLIESGPQMNPAISRRSPVLPLWLPSACTRSQTLLETMIGDFPQDVPILFQVWPTVQTAPDTVSTEEWNRVLSGRRGRWLGIDPNLFPEDFAGMVRMTGAIQEWSRRHPNELRRHLRWDELTALQTLLAEGTDSGNSAILPNRDQL